MVRLITIKGHTMATWPETHLAKKVSFCSCRLLEQRHSQSSGHQCSLSHSQEPCNSMLAYGQPTMLPQVAPNKLIPPEQMSVLHKSWKMETLMLVDSSIMLLL